MTSNRSKSVCTRRTSDQLIFILETCDSCGGWISQTSMSPRRPSPEPTSRWPAGDVVWPAQARGCSGSSHESSRRWANGVRPPSCWRMCLDSRHRMVARTFGQLWSVSMSLAIGATCSRWTLDCSCLKVVLECSSSGCSIAWPGLRFVPTEFGPVISSISCQDIRSSCFNRRFYRLSHPQMVTWPPSSSGFVRATVFGGMRSERRDFSRLWHLSRKSAYTVCVRGQPLLGERLIAGPAAGWQCGRLGQMRSLGVSARLVEGQASRPLSKPAAVRSACVG